MAKELRPHELMRQLQRGGLGPFYLFFGPEEFRKERLLERIRTEFFPESARDFNCQVFYADESDPLQILDAARSMPFLFDKRLIIIRRVENFPPAKLDLFLPYLEAPSPSSCLIFMAERVDFRKAFYKKMRDAGAAVAFNPMRERELVDWVKTTAHELGLKIDSHACALLLEMVENRLMDLYAELQKLALSYPGASVGLEEVRELAIHTRTYTIFQVIDEIFFKRCQRALRALDHFLEMGDREAALQVIGMMNRQVRLLWKAKMLAQEDLGVDQMAKKIGVPAFSAKKLLQQSRLWDQEGLEALVALLGHVDAKIKSGSQDKLLLENLIVSLCNPA